MAQRVLDKGGFGFFFSNRFPGLDDYNEFIEPYQRIGSLEAAASIQKALEFFTHGKPPGGLRRGVDIPTVSRLRGHTNPAFTMKVYVHLTDDQKNSL